jgi:hypothetical protein
MAGKTVGDNDLYSNEEAQRRLEAALRGAREVGHEPMKNITPKRPKAKTGAKKANRQGKGGRHV